MKTIIEITNCVIELFIVLFFFKQMLNLRSLSKSKQSFIITIVLILHIARSFIHSSTYFNFAITGVLWGFLLIFLFKDLIWKKISMLLLYFVFLITSDVLCRVLLSFITGTVSQHHSYSNIERYLGMILSNIITLTLMAFICVIAKNKLRQVDFKYWLMMLLFPFFSLFTVISCDIFIVLSGVNNIYYISLLLIIIIGLLYFNFLVFEFIESYSAKIQLRAAEELIDFQKKNYQLLEINEKELRKLKHDIISHMAVIKTLIENRQINQSSELLDSLNNISAFPTSITYTNDSTLDSILNLECKKAVEKGIKYTVTTHKMYAPINISSIDKSTILCNAINNAIDACYELSEKFILIDIESSLERIKITIENSSPPVKFLGNTIFTTKKDFKNHGFGIDSIRFTLKKYDGSLDISYSDGVTKYLIIANNPQI